MPSADEHPERPEPAAHPRRGRRWIVAVAVIVLIVAAAVTVARSQPEGLGFAEHQTEAQQRAAAEKRAGTTCAGWPLALTPTARPADVAGTVTLWGERSAFRLANASTAAVTVDIVAQAGSLRPVDGSAEQVADDHLRATLEPGGEAAFTATCETAALGLATTPRSVGFATGLGPEPSPLTIEKRRAG